jgi:hypothetical protein
VIADEERVIGREDVLIEDGEWCFQLRWPHEDIVTVPSASAAAMRFVKSPPTPATAAARKKHRRLKARRSSSLVMRVILAPERQKAKERRHLPGLHPFGLVQHSMLDVRNARRARVQSWLMVSAHACKAIPLSQTLDFRLWT